MKYLAPLLIALTFAACDPPPPRTIASPSGHYLLQVVNVRDRERVEEVLLVVEDTTSGARVLLPGEWAARFNISFNWDGHDRIWVNSSDLGVFTYEHGEAGWRKLTDDEQRPLPPPRWD